MKGHIMKTFIFTAAVLAAFSSPSFAHEDAFGKPYYKHVEEKKPLKNTCQEDKDKEFQWMMWYHIKNIEMMLEEMRDHHHHKPSTNMK
jgi:hypothetical protein